MNNRKQFFDKRGSTAITSPPSNNYSGQQLDKIKQNPSIVGIETIYK